MASDEGYQRGMVVIAHPDDAEYGCAGNRRQMVQAGYVRGLRRMHRRQQRQPRPQRRHQLADPDPSTGTTQRLQSPRRRGRRSSSTTKTPCWNPPSTSAKTSSAKYAATSPDVLICETPMRTLRGYGYMGHPDHFASGEAAMAAMFPAARDRLTFPRPPSRRLRAPQNPRTHDYDLRRRGLRQMDRRHRHHQPVPWTPSAST